MNADFRTGALAALIFALIAATPPATAQGEQTADHGVAGPTGANASAEPQHPAPPARAPEDVGDLEAQSRQAYEDGNYLRYYIANRKLHGQRPFVAEYMVNLVRACALLNKTSTAYHYMLQMQKQGLSYDFDQTDDTASIRGTEAYDYINKLMVEAGQPAGDGELAFTLEGQPSDYSALAWDAAGGRLLAGTLSEGKVLALSEDGQPGILLEADENNGLWSIKGLAVDSSRNRLWVSSSATPRFKDFTPLYRNRNALFEFDLATLQQVGRYNLPDDGAEHELGDLAVAATGNVFVIDEKSPMVYVKTQEGQALEPFVTSPDLVSLSAVAVTPDDRRLYVADRIMGVFIVDPMEETSAMLGGPEDLNLGGITGVEVEGGRLFIVQGELAPQRLMRLELNDRGATATTVSPMAIALPPFDGLAASALAGDAIYYVANSAAGDSAKETLIMRTPLDSGTEIEAPEMRQFQQQIKEKQEH